MLEIPLLAGICGLLLAGFLARWILRRKEVGRKESRKILEGANVFMRRQYFTIAYVAFFIAAGLLIISWKISLSFLIGAGFSMAAGLIGMSVSVRSNSRAAAQKSLREGLKLSTRGGAVTGFFVASLALLGLTLIYWLWGSYLPLIGFGFGGSLVSLFARIGGGIYTKSADIGADLVGKIEKKIPEDDPRNAGVIADQVGDNVGDCAGMGADLFETYSVSMAGAILLGFLLAKKFVYYPLFIGAAGLLGCGIAIFIQFGKRPMSILYKIVAIAIGFTALFSLIATRFLSIPYRFYWPVIAGIGVVAALFGLTEYYTSELHKPAQRIAKASRTGHATNIISQLSVSFQSPVLPTLSICAGILSSFLLAGGFGSFLQGIYGIAIGVVGMVSITAIIVALDSYGPITDNAAGIAEMANLSAETKERLDKLDAVGNTTKAITKAFAIGTAAFAALTLFWAYQQELAQHGELTFSLSNPLVLCGLFIGGFVPFLFSSLCIRAVSDGASSVIKEVRKQFKELRLLEGIDKPQYGRCVDIVTKTALRWMIWPGLLAVATPLLVGFLLGPLALGGFLLGSIVTGLMLALLQAQGGAAADNAKKYIEDGHYGGKGSLAHKAAVTGDTVGDPLKDTAGPAINPLIKTMNTITILFVGLIVTFSIL